MGESSDSVSSGGADAHGRPTFRDDVAKRVFERYVHRLKALVRWKLEDRIRNKEGTSAVVQSALASFFQGHPDLEEPEGLWPLLAIITKRKAIDTANRFKAASRDIDREQVPASDSDGSAASGRHLEHFASGPEPDEATAFLDLIESLPEDQLKLVQYRLSAYTYAEIARKISEEEGRPCSEKTVQRRFREIRNRLESLLDE